MPPVVVDELLHLPVRNALRGYDGAVVRNGRVVLAVREQYGTAVRVYARNGGVRRAFSVDKPFYNREPRHREHSEPARHSHRLEADNAALLVKAACGHHRHGLMSVIEHGSHPETAPRMSVNKQGQIAVFGRIFYVCKHLVKIHVRLRQSLYAAARAVAATGHIEAQHYVSPLRKIIYPVEIVAVRTAYAVRHEHDRPSRALFLIAVFKARQLFLPRLHPERRTIQIGIVRRGEHAFRLVAPLVKQIAVQNPRCDKRYDYRPHQQDIDDYDSRLHKSLHLFHTSPVR